MSDPVKRGPSSIFKKIVMASSGLLLCLFLVAHLGGNLLLYIGPEYYNAYAHHLHSQEWLVKTAEVGLVVLFGAHIFYALTTDRDNREARPVTYAVKRSKQDGGGFPVELAAHSWMFLSGIIVLVFLLWHLADFTFEVRLAEATANRTPAEKAIIILKDPASAILYVVGCILLGWHLSHGFWSASQTLGVSHPRYSPYIKYFGLAFSIAVGLGFASFPFWAGTQDVPTAPAAVATPAESATH